MRLLSTVVNNTKNVKHKIPKNRKIRILKLTPIDFSLIQLPRIDDNEYTLSSFQIWETIILPTWNENISRIAKMKSL
jgi:hypothetical protein